MTTDRVSEAAADMRRHLAEIQRCMRVVEQYAAPHGATSATVTEFHKHLLQRIRDQFAARKTKQTELAAQLGISQPHISNALRGARKRVSPWILDSLAEAAGLEITVIIRPRRR